MTIQLTIPRSKYMPGIVKDFASLAEASKFYLEMSDMSGEGASTFRDGKIVDGRKKLRVSYNGRVWDGEDIVFDPYA